MNLGLLTLSIFITLGGLTLVNADDKENSKTSRRSTSLPETLFKRMDANGDRKVSKDEFSKFRESMQDRMKENGKRGNDQGKNRKTNGFAESLFQLGDTDKDGFLTIDEFKRLREKMTDRIKESGPGKRKKTS
ncbi:MAG TPA: hypothetical protein PKA06_03295 [Gemmatales bacterium]|nr:hypothetical protein [Gemmatales bacterium]HMP16791.1 hypothetical protein [Gemmatales bacterium]